MKKKNEFDEGNDLILGVRLLPIEREFQLNEEVIVSIPRKSIPFQVGDIAKIESTAKEKKKEIKEK